MKFLDTLKDFLLKIWAWILHFFIKERKVNKKKIIKKQSPVKPKTKFIGSVNRDEIIENSIITMYPGIYPKELESINKKLEKLKNKIQVFSNETLEEELNSIKKINEVINNNQILVSQIDELNEILDITLKDEELNLNTNEKINILKDNIISLFDENLKDYEKHIIEKAYYEHEKVNYVIVTSMLIDEIYDELEMINDNYQKKRYSKKEFFDKVRKIEKKLERLEKINNRKEVEKEIELLKNDLYTKRKDKYDLLYNKEIFINLKKQCDNIIKQVEINEKKRKEVKIEKQKNDEKLKKEELNKEKNKKDLEKQQEELEEEKIREENILRRFIDLELARQILAVREIEKLKKFKKENIIDDTLISYQEFLLGDNHDFNFVRNKIKLEVVKLYNDTLRNICVLEGMPFNPTEHINIKLSDVIEETLSNQQHLNNLLLEKKKVNVEETKVSMKVTEKLTGVLEKEKEREMINGKNKVLVKTHQPVTNNKEDKKSNNCD